MRRTILILSALYSCILPLLAQNWSQMNKVVSNERAVNDQFGFSVAISGDFAIIGNHREDEDANGNNFLMEAGAAHLFRREGCSWIWHQKIVASDREAGSEFGSQVAIEGDYAFVCTYVEDKDQNGANPLLDAGAVYVFHNENGLWVQTQKLVAPDRAAEDFFGYSLAVSDNKLIVGAYREDEDANGLNFISSAGSAYVFNNINGIWTFQQKLVSSDRGSVENFGFSVDMENNSIIVGAHNDREDENGNNPLNGAGSAYYFQFDGNQWVQSQKIASYERVVSNQFGYNCKLSGNYLFVSTPREAEDENGANTKSFAGAVYVLHNNGSSWVHHQKIVAPDRAIQDFFGNNLSASEGNLLVSAYREDEDSIGLNTLADAGSAYLFKNISGNWQFSQKICPADRGVGDLFSLRLDIDGDYILLSSSLDDEDVSGLNTVAEAGSAYFFRNTEGSPCDAFDVCLAIDALIQSINSSNIPAGTKTSLISKLQSAKSSFQNGQNTAAINKLNAFINEVQAQSGKKIPVELANGWITDAVEIIEAIESGEAVCGEQNEEFRNIKTIRELNGDVIQTKLDIHPNPTSDKIDFRATLSTNAIVLLTDISGRIMYQTEVIPVPGNAVYSIDIGKLNLESGYYHLSLLDGSQISNNKIFILR